MCATSLEDSSQHVLLLSSGSREKMVGMEKKKNNRFCLDWILVLVLCKLLYVRELTRLWEDQIIHEILSVWGLGELPGHSRSQNHCLK